MKTAELSGAALDWAVAKCDGYFEPREPVGSFLDGVIVHWRNVLPHFKPSTNWMHGGPIIDHADISFRKYYNPGTEAHGTYYAMVCRASGQIIRWSKNTASTGPTALIAAMRCYVASKLGDEVEIPQELQ